MVVREKQFGIFHIKVTDEIVTFKEGGSVVLTVKKSWLRDFVFPELTEV